MKQQVFVIGRDLRTLVPYGLAFTGSEYDVNLVQAEGVVARAKSLAAQHDAWYLLLLDAGEDPADLERLCPAASSAVPESSEPLVALADLIAMSAWDETSAAAGAPQAEEQYG